MLFAYFSWAGKFLELHPGQKNCKKLQSILTSTRMLYKNPWTRCSNPYVSVLLFVMCLLCVFLDIAKSCKKLSVYYWLIHKS